MKRFKEYWPFLILFICCIYLSFNLQRRDARKVIYSDPEGYYMYLPAVFINGGFENLHIVSPEFANFPGTEKVFTKFTYGVALMEMPFFLIGHVYASLMGYETSGYSYPYRIAIMFAAVFYLIAALILLYKVLIRSYSKKISLFAVITIFLSTNLYFYILNSPGASHPYSFFLFSLIIYLTPKFVLNNSKVFTFIYALVIGLIIIIRPTNGIILFYPLFYNINSYSALIARIKLFFLSPVNLIIIILGVIIPILPQLYYWNYITGNWLFYSYEDEGFIYWKEPKIGLVLFGAWSGWLLYTPIGYIFILGLLLMVKNNIHNSRIILFILILCTYIFASWWCWWFGGSFGHRSYIEFYALLAIPFAYIVNKIFNNKIKIVKYVGITIILLCIYQNIGITYLYHPPWDGPDWTMKEYKAILIKIATFNFK